MWAGDPEVANSPDSAAQNVIPMYELKWSYAEKTVPCKAFDLALGKELEALLQEAKGRAARIEEPSELWDLESWLTDVGGRFTEGMTTATPSFHSCLPNYFSTAAKPKTIFTGLDRRNSTLFAEPRPSERPPVTRGIGR
jgi:hypothetical protein